MLSSFVYIVYIVRIIRRSGENRKKTFSNLLSVSLPLPVTNLFSNFLIWFACGHKLAKALFPQWQRSNH